MTVVISDQQCCVCAGRRISTGSVTIKLSPVQKQTSFLDAMLAKHDFFNKHHLQNETLALFQKFCLNIKVKRLPLQINCHVQSGHEDSPEMFCPFSTAITCFYSRPISKVTPPSALSLSFKLSFGATLQH